VTNVCSGEDRGHCLTEGSVPRAAPVARLRGACTAPDRSPDQARVILSTTRGGACEPAFANRCTDEPYAGRFDCALRRFRRPNVRAEREESRVVAPKERQSPALPMLEHLVVTETVHAVRENARRDTFLGPPTFVFRRSPAPRSLLPITGNGTRERFTPPSTPRRVKRLRANRGAFHHPGGECALSRAFTSRRRLLRVRRANGTSRPPERGGPTRPAPLLRAAGIATPFSPPARAPAPIGVRTTAPPDEARWQAAR